MFIYLHFLNLKIGLFLHCYIATKIVEKNDESAMKMKDKVDILLNMLKRHGTKYISTVKCLDYFSSHELMEWIMMVLSARMEKCSQLETNFGIGMFDFCIFCVRFQMI